MFGLFIEAGFLSNLAKMAAIRHDTTMISSGTGLGSSATIGAIIVTNLAVTLHVPNTLPMNLFGKYCSVLIYSIAKAAPVPNFAASTVKGTGSAQALAVLAQRPAAESTVKKLAVDSPLTEPSLTTMQPAIQWATVSLTDETTELV